jgi:hypothetical protein
VALGLAALHLASFLAVPAFDAHQAPPERSAAWERAHDQACQPVHRPDRCALCRLASARFVPAPAAVVATAAPVSGDASAAVAVQLPRARTAVHPDSRGPPLPV